MTPEEQKKKYGQIIAKCWTDPSFKQKLEQQPKETLNEFGFQLPEGTDIKICENTDSTYWFVLPAKPKNEINETDLKRMAGGESDPTIPKLPCCCTV